MLVVGAIRLYQHVAPKALRDRCIFRESCSDHVLRVTREDGMLGGVSALWSRMRRCRPGYALLTPSELLPHVTQPVRLADGSIVDLGEIRVERAFPEGLA